MFFSVGSGCYLNETYSPSNVLNKSRKILMFLNIVLNTKKTSNCLGENACRSVLGESLCIRRCLHCLK